MQVAHESVEYFPMGHELLELTEHCEDAVLPVPDVVNPAAH